MRLLYFDSQDTLQLTGEISEKKYPYAILSHTWGPDKDEVTFQDVHNGTAQNKAGYAKIVNCGRQAAKDKLEYFWVDTCCIDKSSSAELSEALNSMFRWYRNAIVCYAFLSDVTCDHDYIQCDQPVWELDFRRSRWFTRGWTLQELIAPKSLEFFSKEWVFMGTRRSLEIQVGEITGIPLTALQGALLSDFSIDERMQWTHKRKTTREEDKAYCLLGIFNISMPILYGEQEEKAFVRLRKELGVAAPVKNVHWMVYRKRNTLFVGRQDILSKFEKVIRSALQDGTRDDQCVLVITGIGGQGKSEICLQLAERVRSLFWGVFWVDVSTVSTAEKDFINITRSLRVSESSWQNGRQALANEQRPWLLILDNADNPEIDYEEYFPSGRSGVVMLTSRIDECKQYASDITNRIVSLNGLPMTDAQNLVFKAAEISHNQKFALAEDVHKVVTVLHSHPLALIQAGTYVAHGYCTFEQYPEVFKYQQTRLLSFQPKQKGSRYGNVYATFEASAMILQSSATEAYRDTLKLLSLLAVGAPNRLPLWIFEEAWMGSKLILQDQGHGFLSSRHVSYLPDLIQADGHDWDSFRLDTAINILKSLALISTDEYDGRKTITMHPLIHKWARDRQDEQQQHDSWMTMGVIMAFSSKFQHLPPMHGRELKPHLQALLDWKMQTIFRSKHFELVVNVLENIGWQLYYLRDDEFLFEFLDQLCTQLGLNKLVVCSGWIDLYRLIGLNLRDCGKIEESILIEEQILNLMDGTSELDRLRSQEHLAMAYIRGKRVEEGLKLLENVSQGKEKMLSGDHEDLLITKHYLAFAYSENREIEKAIKLYEKVVKLRERNLTEDHPNLIISQHSLAFAYLENGQIEEAVSLFKKVVEIRKRIVPKEYPDQLKSQLRLAQALWIKQEHYAARSLMSNVVGVYQEAFDAGYPERILAERWLAKMQHPSEGQKELSLDDLHGA